MRAQFSDATNIQLGLRSLRVFERFAEDFGQEIDLHQVGYLFLLDRPEDVDAFTANVALQNELGVPSRMIEPAEARRLSPLIDLDGVLAASWSPEDGHCTPESVVLGYAGAARRAGARILTHCAVTGIEVVDGEVRAVLTEAGRVRTEAVVCAAGAWSQALGEMAGVDLPVEPLRRQILTTGPVPGADADTPFTIDFSTSFYFHSEGPGLLLGMSDPDEKPGLRARPLRRLAAAPGRSGRATGAGARRSRHRLGVGRALRDDARPQRSGGGGPRRVPVPLRHRLLRPRLPDGARRWARWCATSTSAGRRSWTSAASTPAGSRTGGADRSSTSCSGVR